MDQEQFDHLTRGLAAGLSRRGTLRILTGAALGGILVAVGGSAAGAKKKHRKKQDRGRHSVAAQGRQCKSGGASCGTKGKNFTCYDLQTDANNCGSCGNRCGTGNNNGQPCCYQGTCTSLNDPHTCGSCNNNCVVTYPPTQCSVPACQSQSCVNLVADGTPCNVGGECDTCSGGICQPGSC